MPYSVTVHLEFATNCKPYCIIISYSFASNTVLFFISNETKRTFGTIAEVYEHSIEIETTQSFQIKAMGHQRFEVIDVNKFPER